MSKSSELRDTRKRFGELDVEMYDLGNKHSRGTELAIEEDTTRDVTFASPFYVIPVVVAGFADNSTEISACTAYNVTTVGFRIGVRKSGGGAVIDRDVSWIATTSGNP